MSPPRDWTLLFSKPDLRSVLRARRETVADVIRKVPEQRFAAEGDDLIAGFVAADLVVSPIELLKSDVTIEPRDARIDVSQDPNRIFRDRSRAHYLDGLEVSYYLPFQGERDLFFYLPESYTLNPPRAIVEKRELVFPIDAPDRDVAATKARFDGEVASIEKWLETVNRQVAEHNSSVERLAAQSVAQRRQQLAKTGEAIADLGYPIRKPAASSAKASAKPPPPAPKKREYDVALSFAGEDRKYVEELANELRTRRVNVFYDRFEQLDLWGSDLAEHLGKVYSESAYFVVIFSSRHYATKAWPNHEKQFALGRHLKGQTGRILPVRLDPTEVPGIPPTLGYLDARSLTKSRLAELIVKKVEQVRGPAQQSGED